MGPKAVISSILSMVVMAMATIYLFLVTDRVYGLDFSIIFFFLTYVFLVVAFFASIILHETGHLVFGFLTGYSLLFIRFFSYAFSKEEDGFRLRRFGVQGTGGQCLMIPKERGQNPFVLYFLGGGIFNIATALLGLWAMISVPHVLGRYLFLFLGFYAILGIGLGSTNLIPLVVNGIPNDGYNVRLLLQDKRRVNAFFEIQRLTQEMFRGVRPKDMETAGLEKYDVLEADDLFRISIISFQVLHLIDTGELEEALERIRGIQHGIWKAPASYRMDILQSALFLESYHKRDREKADDLYLILERYLTLKHSSDGWLTMGAYHLCIREDRETAIALLKQAEDSAATSPFKGAAEGDLVYIRKLLEEAMGEGPEKDPGRTDGEG